MQLLGDAYVVLKKLNFSALMSFLECLDVLVSSNDRCTNPNPNSKRKFEK